MGKVLFKSGLFLGGGGACDKTHRKSTLFYMDDQDDIELLRTVRSLHLSAAKKTTKQMLHKNSTRGDLLAEEVKANVDGHVNRIYAIDKKIKKTSFKTSIEQRLADQTDYINECKTFVDTYVPKMKQIRRTYKDLSNNPDYKNIEKHTEKYLATFADFDKITSVAEDILHEPDDDAYPPPNSDSTLNDFESEKKEAILWECLNGSVSPSIKNINAKKNILGKGFYQTSFASCQSDKREDGLGRAESNALNSLPEVPLDEPSASV